MPTQVANEARKGKIQGDEYGKVITTTPHPPQKKKKKKKKGGWGGGDGLLFICEETNLPSCLGGMLSRSMPNCLTVQ